MNVSTVLPLTKPVTFNPLIDFELKMIVFPFVLAVRRLIAKLMTYI